MAKAGQPDEKIIAPVAKAITKIFERLFILKLSKTFFSSSLLFFNAGQFF